MRDIQNNKLSDGFWVFVLNKDVTDLCFATYEILWRFEDYTIGAVVPIARSPIIRWDIKRIGIVLKNRSADIVFPKKESRPLFIDSYGTWIHVEHPVMNGFTTVQHITNSCGGSIKTMGLSIYDIVPYFETIKKIIEEN